MSIRVMAKKAYEFAAVVSGEVKKVRVEPLIVATVPDWVQDHDLFKLAQKSSNIEIMGKPSQDFSMGELEEIQEKAREYGIKNYKNMKLETLKAKIAEQEAANQNPANQGDMQLEKIDEESQKEQSPIKTE